MPLSEIKKFPHADRPRLTPREKQLVRLIASAKPMKQIGAELGLSPNTVAQYCARLYAKCGVSSAREIAAVVFRWDSEDRDDEVAA